MCKKQEIQNQKVERRLLGKNLRFVQRVQLAASAKQAGGVNGSRRDEAAVKNGDYEGIDEEKQIKRKNGRWKPMVVTELLAADCDIAWFHAGWGRHCAEVVQVVGRGEEEG